MKVNRRYGDSKNPFLRKGEALVTRSARNVIRRIAHSSFPDLPPVLVNSVPKSGTHLLTQITAGLASSDDWGTFIASTPSRKMREIPPHRLAREITNLVPGEAARGHVFWHPQLEAAMDGSGIVSYFIYRDPRDVALSEARYLTSMNKYHRMHGLFKNLAPNEALMLSIKGWPAGIAEGVYFPDVATRYRRYTGWLAPSSTLPVRYEDLRGPDLDTWIRRIVDHYVNSSGHDDSATEPMFEKAKSSIDPHRSHTYRQGKAGGWKEAFQSEHIDAFDSLAGNLLVELGYEPKAICWDE